MVPPLPAQNGSSPKCTPTRFATMVEATIFAQCFSVAVAVGFLFYSIQNPFFVPAQFLAMVVSGALAGTIYARRMLDSASKSHIKLTALGIEFQRLIGAEGELRGRPSGNRLERQIYDWSKLQSVMSMTRHGLFRVSMLRLQFSGGEVVFLGWEQIVNDMDPVVFFTAVRTWAPHVAIIDDAHLLKPREQLSYTELWLNDLSGPTRRLARARGLAEGTILKETYRIIKVIGSGGQGVTYLADCQDKELPSQVVVKEYILPATKGAAIMQRAAAGLMREADLLKRINNEQIVRFIEFFVEGDRGYMVMEHVDGFTLEDLVEREGPQPEQSVCSIAVQICDILDYLHNLTPPIVHGDLTPDNLMLQPDGKVKLLDFDVAREINSTQTRTVVGKHAYMAPEQFKGRMESRSDVYSLGATLYYLLTASQPEPISVLHPREIRPQVSPVFDLIVARATMLDPEQRCASVRQLKASLPIAEVDA